MRRNFILLCIIVCTIAISCHYRSHTPNDTEKQQIPNTNRNYESDTFSRDKENKQSLLEMLDKDNNQFAFGQNEYLKTHSFYDTNNIFLGTLMLNLIDDNIFSSLLIIKMNDTLYRIDGHVFYSEGSIDIQVYDDNCIEYKISKIADDYIDIYSICRETKSISDLIEIYWDYDDEKFMVFKPPF